MRALLAKPSRRLFAHLLAPGLALALALTMTAGCGSDGGGGTDGQVTADAEIDAPAIAVMCSGTTTSFPTFERSCTDTSDCIIAFHQYSCCGSRRAQGINKSQRSRFDTAEATCEGQYPACGCPAAQTSAEDGKSGDESTIMVRCTAVGSCSTFIP
jgi:hypothetical protein